MSFKLCTSGAIVTKAGVYCNSTAATSGAILEQCSNEAEGFICAKTRYDWVTNYTAIGANYKPILADVCSCLGGAALVNYDYSGYTGMQEAINIINLLYDRAMKGLEILDEQKTKEVMGAVQMAMMSKVLLGTGSNVYATYDYTDIAAGTGYVNYYPAITFSNATSGSLMTNFTLYSHQVTTSKRFQAPDAPYFSQALSVDFDVTFNMPQTVKGDAIINIPYGIWKNVDDDYFHSRIDTWVKKI